MKNTMKRIIIGIIGLFLFSAVIYGETAEQQIAYRFLDDYIINKAADAENGRKIGGTITLGMGLLLTSAATSLYFWGDDIFTWNDANGEPVWSDSTRNAVCLSLGIGGLVTLGTGIALLATPRENYTEKFSYIYNEEDPVVQEALAAAALYDMAETGKRNRITSGILNLAAPLLSIALSITFNLAENRSWNKDIGISTYSLSWNLISGFSKLFFDKSKEERLYDKYRHTKEVLLVSRKDNITFLD